MIQSVYFGDKNTWDDWKILAEERPVVAPAEPKNLFVDIPGGNGTLDFSEALAGYPTYQDRKGNWTFKVMNDYVQWYERYGEIMSYLHGKKMKMRLIDDPEWFYEGRFSVDDWASGDTWSRITLGYIVNPYKWSVLSSTDPWLWDPFNFETGLILEQEFSSITINSPSNWVVFNWPSIIFGEAPISPTLTITNASGLDIHYINSKLGIDATIRLNNGVNYLPDVIFWGQDIYKVEFRGVGTIKFDFRTGRF